MAVMAPDGLNTLVTAADAAAVAGVAVETIRSWRHRGLIEPSGLDERGRPLYRLLDIAKAERATREKARRTWR
jgi:DNA-binding transcriptional MerR regulator